MGTGTTVDDQADLSCVGDNSVTTSDTAGHSSGATCVSMLAVVKVVFPIFIMHVMRVVALRPVTVCHGVIVAHTFTCTRAAGRKLPAVLDSRTNGAEAALAAQEYVADAELGAVIVKAAAPVLEAKTPSGVAALPALEQADRRGCNHVGTAAAAVVAVAAGTTRAKEDAGRSQTGMADDWHDTSTMAGASSTGGATSTAPHAGVVGARPACVGEPVAHRSPLLRAAAS